MKSINIVKDESHPCFYRFDKHGFVSKYHSSVDKAICEYLRQHGYLREKYEFTYNRRKFEGIRVAC
jgi:hypothetical protein